MIVDITGLDKAEVLAALYNASRPLRLGFDAYDSTPMTVEEAGELLKETTHFDYVNGRVMKVSLSEDTFESWLYDRDNGENAASQVIESLRTASDANNELIRDKHASGTAEAASEFRTELDNKELPQVNLEGEENRRISFFFPLPTGLRRKLDKFAANDDPSEVDNDE